MSTKEMQESKTRWRMAAASVQGVSHVRSEQPCQDAHAVALLPGGALIVAVADGAGSATLSEVGAALAAQTAVTTIAASHPLPAMTDAESWQALLQESAQCALLRLAVEAEARCVDLNALATTLLLAVATETGTAALQIGDGAIVHAALHGVEGEVEALTVPQNGEYANTTVFLTSPTAIETAQFSLHPPASALALFSDGLQRIALDMASGRPFAPFFQPLFRFVANEADPTAAQAQLAAFLSSPRVQERSDDDLTLVLAARWTE